MHSNDDASEKSALPVWMVLQESFFYVPLLCLVRLCLSHLSISLISQSLLLSLSWGVNRMLELSAYQALTCIFGEYPV